VAIDKGGVWAPKAGKGSQARSPGPVLPGGRSLPMLPWLFPMVQLPRAPDLEAQRTAMRKFGFLVGKWFGTARLFRAKDAPLELRQSEEAQYKLDGLVLLIEGVGRTKSEDQPVLQALGLISYDDQGATYRMRAFNDGRFLDTEVKLLEQGRGMSWGFSFGEIATRSVLKIDETGAWTELTEISIGSQPPRKLLELIVRPSA
jgi:hypothetical protein